MAYSILESWAVGSATTEAKTGIHTCDRIATAGLCAKWNNIFSVKQGITEIGICNGGTGEAAARGNHTQ